MALLQISEPGQSTKPHERRLAAGIDLGTTNSLVATVRSGQAETLPDEQGEHLLPSVPQRDRQSVANCGLFSRAILSRRPLIETRYLRVHLIAGGPSLISNRLMISAMLRFLFSQASCLFEAQKIRVATQGSLPGSKLVIASSAPKKSLSELSEPPSVIMRSPPIFSLSPDTCICS